MTSDILTDRLVLCAAVPEDGEVVCRELANWGIASMLATALHPFPQVSNEEWWAERQPRAFPEEGLWRMLSLKDDPSRTAIGNVSLCPRDGKWGLGYWLAEAHWGQGLMSEAACAAVAHVTATWAPEKIIAGAYTDNPASGRILEKAGFHLTGTTPEWCEARQVNAPHWNYEFT